ncbi:hypothetical protein Pla8534_15280 [Lignipirellula cremea]|uniref:Uncharacterized protein n=1 Tax=Lignipirellula cremea TaxID=2528010 RepID=A0A518DPH4_9BACT|nr:hypothetical protein Pla8534_15280 [Lignipirellula cremea]
MKKETRFGRDALTSPFNVARMTAKSIDAPASLDKRLKSAAVYIRLRAAGASLTETLCFQASACWETQLP